MVSRSDDKVPPTLARRGGGKKDVLTGTSFKSLIFKSTLNYCGNFPIFLLNFFFLFCIFSFLEASLWSLWCVRWPSGDSIIFQQRYQSSLAATSYLSYMAPTMRLDAQ